MTGGHTRTYVDNAFAIVERAAAAGERCPINNQTLGITTDAILRLCDEGAIRSEIFGYNWRVIEILKGPHAGKRTMADPKGGRLWKIFDENGVRLIRRNIELRTSKPRNLKNSDAFASPRGPSG